MATKQNSREKPRPLELYPRQYFQVLQAVRERGRVFAEMPSEREANTVKTDWRRFRLSLMEFAPESEDAQTINKIMMRKHKHQLEFLLREEREAMRALEMACLNPDSRSVDNRAQRAEDKVVNADSWLDKFEQQLIEEHPPES